MTAARRLRRSPVFATLAIATLTVAVGVNGAVLGLVRGILLEELPFHRPDRLFLLDVEVPAQDEMPGRGRMLEAGQAEALAAEASAFSGVAVHQPTSVALVGVGTPVRLPAARVSANFFDVLGATPRLGRAFSDGGWTTAEPEVVLSTDLWQSKLGADPDVVGRRLTLDDRPHTVVGVMPAEVAYPHRHVALWTARVAGAGQVEPGTVEMAFLPTVVRLADGATPQRARLQVDRLLADAGDTADGGQARLTDLRDSLVGDTRTPLTLLAGAVLLVLVIAAFNLIHLFLARAAQRRPERAVQRALGARPRHRAGQVVSEVVWIGGVAGALGFLLAAALLRLLPRWMPDDLPRAEAVRLDVVAFFTTLGLALGVALACALVASWRRGGAGTSAVAEALRAAHLETRSTRAWRRGLVVLDVALALLVMVAAGLLLRSYSELSRTDLGFDGGPALVATLELGASYPGPAQREAFWDDLVGELERHPAVEGVGLVAYPPLAPGFSMTSLAVVGEPPGPTLAIPQHTNDQYHQAAALRVAAGRWLQPDEHRSGAPVAVVDETFVERFVPGDGPFPDRALDRQVELAGHRLRIVGVVETVRMVGPTSEGRPAFYTSYRTGGQAPARMTLVIRTDAGDPVRLAPFLRQAVAAIDPHLPVDAVGTLDQRVATATARPRFYALLLTSFALVATLLAAAGVYALLAQLVIDRTRDLGIRRALGAGTRDVALLVVREGALLVATGLLVGFAAATAGARLLASQLYTVSTYDVATWIGATAVVVLVATAAGLVPLARAVRIDPLVALRHE